MLKRLFHFQIALKSFVIVLISYLILMLSSNSSLGSMLDIIFIKSTKIQIFNFIFLMMFFWGMLAIFKSFWIATSLFLSANIIVSITNYEKIKYRNEGILPVDLSMIRSIGKILSMVNIWIVFMGILLILILVYLIYYFQKTLI
ncbi:hypothetical protein VC81_12730 [Levilactobacillus spicheri]|uniref:Uncharacterized protein n=1 Tax=Levilactobacillus spicheri TaxID=216463 RepID=A0A0F3RP56_9LACO|nr:hypothetical protein VC81_12730 [Levilactobacillus spicheri]